MGNDSHAVTLLVWLLQFVVLAGCVGGFMVWYYGRGMAKRAEMLARLDRLVEEKQRELAALEQRCEEFRRKTAPPLLPIPRLRQRG